MAVGLGALLSLAAWRLAGERLAEPVVLEELLVAPADAPPESATPVGATVGIDLAFARELGLVEGSPVVFEADARPARVRNRESEADERRPMQYRWMSRASPQLWMEPPPARALPQP
jgi:hypothetical protein